MSMSNDETTPLLGFNSNNTTRPASGQQLPQISQTAARVSSLDLNHLRFEDIVSHDGCQFEDYPTQVAFALTVLLHLREKSTTSSRSSDLYERWLASNAGAHDASILEEKLVDIWTLFLAEYRQGHEIDTVLWTRFPLYEGGSESVVDFLVRPSSPASLVSHPLIMSSLEHTWRHGLHIEPLLQEYPTPLTRYDALSTPRILHVLDWVSHISFLGLLVHYVLYPIEQPHTSYNWSEYNYAVREVFLVLLPISFVAQSRTFVNSSSLLVPLAFMTSLPSAPNPDSLSFIFIQWAIFLQPFSLNLSEVPSHLFFFQQRQVLPLAVLITRGVSKVLYPVIAFFLPLLLLATYLLSLSLTDAFFAIYSTEPAPLLTNSTPIDTRFTFLCLFCTVAAISCISTFVLATTTSLSRTFGDPWDRYSHEVGQTARRAYIRATMYYIRPYTFPPPFNLVHLFISLVRKTMNLFDISLPGLAVVERILWRIVVGPFTAFLAIFFWRPGSLSMRYSS